MKEKFVFLEKNAILRQYKPGAAAGGGSSSYAKKNSLNPKINLEIK